MSRCLNSVSSLKLRSKYLTASLYFYNNTLTCISVYFKDLFLKIRKQECKAQQKKILYLNREIIMTVFAIWQVNCIPKEVNFA